MRATLNLPPSVRLIEAALEGLVQVNRVLIETGAVPSSPLDSSVRYKREGRGLEEWDNAYTCVKRGWGDCEDLASWECAYINLTEDEWAMCRLIQTGPKLLHCVVRMSDGSYRDVCPELGMTVAGTTLQGIPWMETRAENIIGSRASDRTSRIAKVKNNPNATVNNKSAAMNRPAYRPKASARPSQDGPAYQPKSSRPAPETQSTSTPDPLDAVSPSSLSQQQAMQAVPMQSYADDAFADVESLVSEPTEDPEAFDEELEETDETTDEDEELAS